MKSLRGFCAYLLVSKTSEIENLPIVTTSRSAVGGLRAGELIEVGDHLLGFAAEIDRLPDESPLNARVRNRSSDLERGPAREAGDALGVAQPESLTNLRIDPKFGAPPQLEPGSKRNIRSLAPGIRSEAVHAAIGRAERRGILLDEGGLPMHDEPAHVERRRSLGEDFRIDAVAAEPVVEAKPQALDGETGIETLRCVRKSDTARAVIGIEIFEPGRPV